MSTYDDQLELEIERYRVTEDFTKLYGMLKTFVVGKSRKYANKYQKRKLRIYQDDFESILWEAALDLINDEGYHSHRFRIVLNYRLEDRAKNVVRDFMWDKHRALTTAVSRTAFPSKEYTEDTATIQVLFEQLERDPSLSDVERHLLHLLKQFPDANNQELSDLMGLGHREKARRIRQRLCRKGLKYWQS